MKLRYRIEDKGWYIPQYLNKKKDEWKDFSLGDLGSTGTQIHEVAYALGKSERWDGNTYHFDKRKGEEGKDMSLIFYNETKVCAFLGAARFYYSEKTREVDL